MPDRVSIRAAVPGDAPELAALATELGYPAGAQDIVRRLPPLLGNPEHLLLVAADPDDRAIGWMHASVSRHLESDVCVEVVGLVVGAADRGAGVGAALLACAEAWARERDTQLVKLHSNVIREEAHRFYLRAGYERVKSSYQFRKMLG